MWETVTSTASTWASKVKEKGSGLWSKTQQDGEPHEGGHEEEHEGGQQPHEGDDGTEVQSTETMEKAPPSRHVPSKPAPQFNWDDTWDEQKGWEGAQEQKKNGDELGGKSDIKQRSWDDTWDEQKSWDEAQWEDVEIRTSKQK